MYFICYPFIHINTVSLIEELITKAYRCVLFYQEQVINPVDLKTIFKRSYQMTKKSLIITTHLPAIPNWIKINSSITVPLPLKSAKELAAKLLEVKEDMEIEIHFETGKDASIGFKYEMKDDTD